MGRIAIFPLILILAACGGQSATPAATGSRTSPSTSASASTRASASPQGWQTARQAADEGARKLAAANQQTLVSNSCPPNQPCIYGGTETDGTKAAYVSYGSGSGAATGPGDYGCIVWVYQDAAGWHFLNAHCTQNGNIPSVGPDMVYTPGTCGNVREQPSTSSHIVKCLPDQTSVEIDQPPTWADGHMWWHLRTYGWMAHDNLMQGFAPGAVG